MRHGFWRRFAGGLVAVALIACGPASTAEDASTLPRVSAAELPAQALATIELIRKGGPYPYQRDGLVFGNFEKRLPPRERGYYREYTVRTPGATGRGTRRIVAGKGGELYYTEDHYQTFRRIRESP
jgi:ribonuclease T1